MCVPAISAELGEPIVGGSIKTITNVGFQHPTVSIVPFRLTRLLEEQITEVGQFHPTRIRISSLRNPVIRNKRPNAVEIGTIKLKFPIVTSGSIFGTRSSALHFNVVIPPFTVEQQRRILGLYAPSGQSTFVLSTVSHT